VLEEYKAELSLRLKVKKVLQDFFLKDPRIYRTRCVGQQDWVSLRRHAAPLDWKEIEELVEGSYRLVAPKKGRNHDG
jgi:predicted DNA-binding protein (MmcQ/YjbR family)